MEDKERTPIANDIRQINQYFDYEKWNDMMNQQGGIKKGKPNKHKKKQKIFKL